VRRFAPRPLAAALEDLTATLSPPSALGRVQEAWERSAGPSISSAATPAAERDGVLTVACESSVWAQELDLMAPELLARLNAELGAGLLHRLRCRVGPPRTEAPPRAAGRAGPARPGEPATGPGRPRLPRHGRRGARG
jgi:predicted nucleic acid-binding Zn ribbon protein